MSYIVYTHYTYSILPGPGADTPWGNQPRTQEAVPSLQGSRQADCPSTSPDGCQHHCLGWWGLDPGPDPDPPPNPIQFNSVYLYSANSQHMSSQGTSQQSGSYIPINPNH
ncbi:hypothetical protein ATANTOWER_023115 [Ataeniobius toweri]|uniref:Uncharacterized protein n=1 Tax=Ataeniobius toweri TaxID=208326 RepID=A0ABU7B853_9TELE|nr:hypothetical protein [Ataeniobius toweri]